MPTATSFTALGRGNGFSSCLTTVPQGDRILRNPPSLAQTMAAYWNLKSISYGGATFTPGNEPMDLICNPNANVGNAEDGSSAENQAGLFVIRNTLPTIFFKNDVKYYSHGIAMEFVANNGASSPTGVGGKSSSTSVSYQSSLYLVDQYLRSYDCTDETFGPDGEVIGKGASERTQTISSVTIGGIPFIKNVIKSFGGTFYDIAGTAAPCPTANYPSVPIDPTLELHTY